MKEQLTNNELIENLSQQFRTGIKALREFHLLYLQHEPHKLTDAEIEREHTASIDLYSGLEYLKTDIGNVQDVINTRDRDRFIERNRRKEGGNWIAADVSPEQAQIIEQLRAAEKGKQ